MLSGCADPCGNRRRGVPAESWGVYQVSHKRDGAEGGAGVRKSGLGRGSLNKIERKVWDTTQTWLKCGAHEESQGNAEKRQADSVLMGTSREAGAPLLFSAEPGRMMVIIKVRVRTRSCTLTLEEYVRPRRLL